MSIKASIEKLPFYNDLVLPWHWVQALTAGTKYHWPAKHLRVIGVTGTNGKTTTSFMIWKMLNSAGHKTGLLTTVAWSGVGGEEKGTDYQKMANCVPKNSSRPTGSERSEQAPRNDGRARAGSAECNSLSSDSPDATLLHQQYEHMTTERVEILNQRMRAIADAGAEFLVLEVTSHALAQFRTLGVPIEIAVFTNLTHEHLDYHKTFANYRQAKLKLFRQSKYGVVNADDANAKYFTELYSPDDITTYGIKSGDLRATNITMDATGISYSVSDIKSHNAELNNEPNDHPSHASHNADNEHSSQPLHITTQIPGEFNVYNSLAAVAVGRRLGLADNAIAKGIHSLTSVEGRMNRIQAGQNFEVIVDYAHTPDALEKVFTSVTDKSSNTPADNTQQITNSASKTAKTSSTSQPPRRIISVHGGAGRRDESTRPLRGEILGKYSDIVIITEDDSRDEDPAKIAEQFIVGAQKTGKTLNKDLFIELDRRKAIEQALHLAKPHDLVLILGKGHEKTILRADGAHPFEDIKVTQEILSQLK